MGKVIVAALMIASALPAAAAPMPEPDTYELRLVYIFDAPRTEFIFVIGSSGFRTVDALETWIATLPAGSALRWNPGCERLGGEPLLSLERDMARFIAFCRDHRIELILVPSG